MRRFLLACLVAATSACSSAPIKVAILPDIKAVRTSNAITRTHIQRTQEHIDKAQSGEDLVTPKLKSVDDDLTELLKQ